MRVEERTIYEPEWEKAPSDATYFDTYSGKWYKNGGPLPADKCQANGGDSWYRSSFENWRLCEKRFIARPTEPTTEVITQETFTMSAEESKALATEARPMQVVTVVFSNLSESKEYNYFAPADARVGQYAVVYSTRDSASSSSFPFTVVKIIADNVIDIGNKANKAVLGTFDESFAKHVQARMEHMARIKGQLQQKKKVFEENAIFEMLAERDPEAAALLSELKSFNL
jgi:hypothetical protein